ncbi:MAG: DUF222 domain-containing protein [Acidimicrobiales bacterium]
MATTAVSYGEVDRAAVHAALDRVLDARSGDDGAALGEAVRSAAAVAAAVDGALVEVVAGLEASGEWARDGHRSPVSWMVAETGAHRAAAASRRATCLRAARLAHVAAAARAGRLAQSHLKLLVDARRAPVEALFDRDEAALVAEALELSADALRRRLARWWFDALAELGENEPDADPGGTDRNQLRLRDGYAGTGLVDGELAPEGKAVVGGALAGLIERWRAEGRLEHDPRTWAELQGDALVALVDAGWAAIRGGGVGVRPLVIGVVDVDTLLRRSGMGPAERLRRRVELVGSGPVSDATMLELASRAGLSLLVTDRGGHPLWFGRSRRLASAAQRSAVVAADGGRCYWPGCDAEAHRCQVDHLVGWEQGGSTDIANLGLICGFHNRAKHRGGFQAARGPDGQIEVRDRDGRLIEPAFRGPPLG